MKPISITLPDGSKRELPANSTVRDVALAISKRLEEAAVAGAIGDKIVDLNTPLKDGDSVKIITKTTPEGLEVIRHSTAHLLAHAVKELYPETQITIGPVTADGFFYDLDRPTQFTPEDLPKIEAKMREIAAKNYDVKRTEYSREQLVQMFSKMGEEFKVEIIKGLPDEPMSAYEQGGFVDLCRGPHVPNTARLGKFKLLSIAGAYWRGDEKNKMLQRIYGTAFATQKELDEYVARIEEAKKRDHRKLGPEIGLFTFLPVAPAMPFFLPKGARLYELTQAFMRQRMRSSGYQEVICPQLMSTELWKKSGHMGHYAENMYIFNAEEGQGMALKPMNCPGHATLFSTKKHSYRELPIRFAEFSRLHRFERAGVTHGLMRTRSFCQDDGHIFCTEDQIREESVKLIKEIIEVYKLFGFHEVELKLAMRPEKYAGTIENWDKATAALAQSLDDCGFKYETLSGEGAFYGPKIEVHIKDSIGRFWQCGTVQCDFFMPVQFECEYVDADNSAKRPVMLHRAILGSFERFLGILIEHTAGHLPIWINPVQIAIINVAKDYEGYAKEVSSLCTQWGYRVETDLREEKLGYKIREAQLQKVPLMVVLGSKEAEGRTVSVRRHTGENINDLTLEAFRQFMEKETQLGGMTY